MIELRMVESVVGFPSEFDGRGLFDREALEESHIKVCVIRPIQGVPANISERQPLRGGKRAGIEKQRTRRA